MSGGVIIAQNAGSNALYDVDGICRAQVAKTLTINGSLTAGGAFSNKGWGNKLCIVSTGDDSANTFTVTGKFYASNAVGAGNYTTTMQVVGASGATATSSLYVGAIDAGGIVGATITAATVTVGFIDDGAAIPVTLNDNASLYAITFAGTFGGATPSVSRYIQDAGEWVGQLSGSTAAGTTNFEPPQNSTVKLVIGSGSTTTSLFCVAELISKQR